MSDQVAWAWVREKNSRRGEPGIRLPATVAARTPAAPISDASRTRPLRMRYMYRPTNRAMGMVQAMVKVPQDEPGTTWAQPAGRRTAPAPAVRGPVSAGARTWNDSGRSEAGAPGAWRTVQPAGKV